MLLSLRRLPPSGAVRPGPLALSLRSTWTDRARRGLRVGHSRFIFNFSLFTFHRLRVVA